MEYPMGNIYLVGFMGTGKSAVGRQLAEKKEWQFIDLDNLIEMKQRMTIADIFAKAGEAHFRRIEKKTLAEVSSEDNFVFACGGGIVLDKENVRIMKSTGKVVCLDATADVILKRTRGTVHRPLLNVEDPRQRIDTLLKFRAPFYAQADHTVDTSKLSIAQVTDKILKWLKEK
ncbi:MAG: shikimate kinase [Candidatus Omnitrophica bacterium]|nr:shikimate kinase [Candidatus Omnitrophota bacterium]